MNVIETPAVSTVIDLGEEPWVPPVYKLKPAVKAAWLHALRSGEYTQARGVLQNEEGNCCLGVLCDIAAKDGVGKWVIQEDVPEGERHGFEVNADQDEADSGTYATAMPPLSVLRWAFEAATPEYGNWFVKAKDPEFNGETFTPSTPAQALGYYTLPTLNDLAGYTFEQIADLIEEQM